MQPLVMFHHSLSLVLQKSILGYLGFWRQIVELRGVFHCARLQLEHKTYSNSTQMVRESGSRWFQSITNMPNRISLDRIEHQNMTCQTNPQQICMRSPFSCNPLHFGCLVTTSHPERAARLRRFGCQQLPRLRECESSWPCHTSQPGAEGPLKSTLGLLEFGASGSRIEASPYTCFLDFCYGSWKERFRVNVGHLFLK